jgi:hypothetical protein
MGALLSTLQQAGPSQRFLALPAFVRAAAGALRVAVLGYVCPVCDMRHRVAMWQGFAGLRLTSSYAVTVVTLVVAAINAWHGLWLSAVADAVNAAALFVGSFLPPVPWAVGLGIDATTKAMTPVSARGAQFCGWSPSAWRLAAQAWGVACPVITSLRHCMVVAAKAATQPAPNGSDGSCGGGVLAHLAAVLRLVQPWLPQLGYAPSILRWVSRSGLVVLPSLLLLIIMQQAALRCLMPAPVVLVMGAAQALPLALLRWEVAGAGALLGHYLGVCTVTVGAPLALGVYARRWPAAWLQVGGGPAEAATPPESGGGARRRCAA